jgi:hypothetical protein
MFAYKGDFSYLCTWKTLRLKHTAMQIGVSCMNMENPKQNAIQFR